MSQDAAVAQVDVVAPAVPTEPAEPAEIAEPAEPTAAAPSIEEPIALGETESTAQTDRHQRDRSSRGVRAETRRDGRFVGVLNNVTVDEDETARVVVSVLADFTLKGRSRNEAVVILGKGQILGPVGGESVTVLGEIRIEAPVEGNVVVVASKAYINAPIGGDVKLIVSEVEFGPNARVGGETVIVGPEPVTHPDAQFVGPKQKIPILDRIPNGLLGMVASLREYLFGGILLGRPMVPSLAWCWYIVGFFFVFRLLLVLLFPKPIETGATILRERALRSFLIGVIAYVLYLPAQALLVATGVGLIAVPFIWLAFEIAGVLGKIALLRSLGGQVARQLGLPQFDTTLAGFITGTVIVTVIYMVPVLGGIVFLLIKPLALGAMLIAAVEGFRRERPAPPNVPPPTQPATPIPPPVLAPAPTANLNAAVGASPAVSAARKTENMPPIIGQSRSRSNDFASEDLASMTRVGFWPRLGATFLDFVPIMIICGPMLRSNELFLLAWIAYHVGMWTWRGTTLGGIVFSLRVVRLDGRPLDFTVAVVRALGSCLSFVVACLGFFWASWNPDKQSWHDMIAGTVIVKTPRSVPLV